ncbi:MAG: ABC transporter ATP-binding protein [Deltaproteobacteria bacterium GWC2_56_8]|nr:MAG: ABC transporter ATP-binding protein [Deltaproteobacteria bacterium GWB2_55_19]OGP36529.1 MAG: ABC transporter ATP-binding protein [Deltaproteobacteria bacterium GWC2_56_8]
MDLITIKGLSKTYGGAAKKVEVLKSIDLSIKKGETVAIVGASGVGKSTLLNIMGALDRPSSGEVLYNGEPLFKYDDKKLSAFRNRSIGFVFQFHHLLPEFTALENVMLPALIGGASPVLARSKAEALLKEVGLGQRLGHKPGELSGGEQQRTAMVRALVQGPDVLLADEPTGNLDTRTGEEVFELLLALNASRSTTMVIVTHNERLAGRLTRRLKMVDGNIREE